MGSHLAIHADLTAGAKGGQRTGPCENAGLCLLGMMKGGPLDLTAEQARVILPADSIRMDDQTRTYVEREVIGERRWGEAGTDDRLDWRGVKQKPHCYELHFEYFKGGEAAWDDAKSEAL